LTLWPWPWKSIGFQILLRAHNYFILYENFSNICMLAYYHMKNCIRYWYDSLVCFIFIPSPTKLRGDIVTLPSVRHNPCKHSRINILQWILTKLGTYLVLKRIWNPIDFQGQGHRVKFLTIRKFIYNKILKIFAFPYKVLHFLSIYFKRKYP
jgi:hypothetical protein